MKLDITAILKNSEERIDFDYAADLSDLTLTYGEQPVTQTVRVCGAVRSAHGAVTLELKALGVLQLRCDRCAKQMQRPFEVPFTAMLSAEPDAEESEKLIVVQGSRLDLDHLAKTALMLSLPSKQLCDEACKGLCPLCGADLNAGDCGCDRRRVDPRLEGLKKLLE